MTNLTENPVYETGIYQLETTDPVLGGPPGFNLGEPVAGHANAQAQQLANRTAYLKQFKDDIENSAEPAKGAGLVGFKRSNIASAVNNINNFLSGQMVSVWEFADLITSKPNLADPETWDWTPAINGAYAFVESNYAQSGLRYGKAVYYPAMKYLVKAPVGPSRIGIASYGDGALSSVITADPAFVGDYIFKAQHINPVGNTGGCSIFNMGIDCNNVAAGGFNIEDGYDCLTIDNLRVSRVHDNHIGFRAGPRTDAGGQPVSQTIFIKQLFVYKNNLTTSTVAPVQLIKVQEAQMIGCKAWAGGYGGAGQAATPAYYLEDCRSIDMIGCSAAGAGDHGILVSAVTKQISGIRLRGMLYENCTGTLETSTTDFINNKILTLYHDVARRESPSSGGFTLDGLSGAILDISTATATLSANTEQCVVNAQRIANVTDGGTRNVVLSHPNAIDNFYGFSQLVRVVRPSTPRYTFGADGVTDSAYLEWSRSSGANNGLRLGVNTGSDVTLAAFKEAPASGNTAMLLLCNDGTNTTVRQVSVGAVDSGGTGFRVLRVPN